MDAQQYDRLLTKLMTDGSVKVTCADGKPNSIRIGLYRASERINKGLRALGDPEIQTSLKFVVDNKLALMPIYTITLNGHKNKGIQVEIL